MPACLHPSQNECVIVKRILSNSSFRRLVNLACLSLLALGFTDVSRAGVVSVTDLNLADQMSITGIPVNTANGITINESYGESTLIPYNSQYPILPDADPYAIVTPQSTYFDKVVGYTGMTQGQSFEFDFQITNNTPYKWHDMHFEIWNVDFTQRLQAPWTLPDPLATDQFTGLDLHTDVGTFYSFPGSGESHDPLETGTYILRMELYAFNSTEDGSFGLRQVATATPEPGTLAIFGIGCGMAMVARRRRSRLAAKESASV